MNFQRAGGILCHITSLPGPYGIGEMGPQAFDWVDKLVAMGLKLWQILPHGVTGYGDSPYQCFSTFAGNPLWISFDLLIEDGLLSKSRLAKFPKYDENSVDYGNVIPARKDVLKSVCRNFDSHANETLRTGYAAFCEAQKAWLEDFALFMALKEAHELRPWHTWEADLVRRYPHALAQARTKYATSIHHTKIQQYLFFRQWHKLRAYANSRGVKVVGDIPIFVAHDSADAWANPDLFYLDNHGRCTVVAGVPPDYFSATGQLWGNPLYRWDEHKRTGYKWWIARMKNVLELVDIVRIDHFRGFEAYWEIPGDAETAINGRWVKGPEGDLFVALEAALGKMPIIAEDLGIITPPVEALRDRFHFPGMRVLQFAFGNDAKAADYRPDSYPANCCVYTGTHDNDTTVGWFNSQAGAGTTRSQEDIDKERKAILDYLKKPDGSNIHWDLIELAFRSNANTAVAPLQDVMGLGTEARMNVPGTTSNNWRWRFTWDMLQDDMVRYMRHLSDVSNRS